MEATPTITETTPSSGLRPTFLTVLCVLTFIASGWGVISGVKGYFTADTTAAMTQDIMDDAEDKMDGKETPSFVKNLLGSVSASMSADNIRKSSIFSVLGNLLTLLGAIMMWTLRKTGFYMYIAGTVILTFSPVIVLGGGMLGGMATMGTGFIGLIFIILYGVNLKYMTR